MAHTREHAEQGSWTWTGMGPFLILPWLLAGCHVPAAGVAGCDPSRDETRGVALTRQLTEDSLRELGAHPDVLGGRVTASIGVATAQGKACDPKTLLQAADEALYAAKSGGRDRIRQHPAG